MRVHIAGETPIWGSGAVRRWVDLLDAAEAALAAVHPCDPCGQRTAGRRLESLFLYEHQMTPRARRRAREYVWRRDRPGELLPGEEPRAAWEACRCWSCRYERRTGQPSVLRGHERLIQCGIQPEKRCA